MFGFKKLKKLLQKHEDEMDQVQPDVLPFDESTIRRAIRNMTDEELEKALAAVEEKIAELEEKEK